MSDSELMNLARAGDAEAQYRLGLQYLEVDDLGEGERWLEQASQQGHAPSLFSMGSVLYKRGNKNGSVSYFVKSANLGHTDALEALAELYKKGNYVMREQIMRTVTPRSRKAISHILRFGALPGSRAGAIAQAALYHAPAAVVGAVAAGLGYVGGSCLYPAYHILPALGAAAGAMLGVLTVRLLRRRRK